MVGKTILYYKILKSSAKAVEDTKLQRTVALKFLPLGVACPYFL